MNTAAPAEWIAYDYLTQNTALGGLTWGEEEAASRLVSLSRVSDVYGKSLEQYSNAVELYGSNGLSSYSGMELWSEDASSGFTANVISGASGGSIIVPF